MNSPSVMPEVSIIRGSRSGSELDVAKPGSQVVAERIPDSRSHGTNSGGDLVIIHR